MDYKFEDGSLRIFLSGDIDHHSSGIIRKETDALIQKLRPEKVILNFRRVQFCDSSGIAIVLGRYKLSVKDGFYFALESLPRSVENIFRLSGIDKIIDFKEKETSNEKSYN